MKFISKVPGFLIGLFTLAASAQVAPVALIAHTTSSNGVPTPPINTTGANAILICENFYNGLTAPVDSTGKNTYVLIGKQQVPGGYTGVSLWAAFNAATSPAHTFSLPDRNTSVIAVSAFSGVASPDQVNGATSRNSGPITPAGANELIFSCLGGQQGNAANTVAPPLALIDSVLTADGGTAFTANAFEQQTAPARVGAAWTSTLPNIPSTVVASFYSTSNPAPLKAATAHLPEGFVGESYSYQLTANGGVAPYTWTVGAATGGVLPAGLKLSANGLISGTPVAAGVNTGTVGVNDVQGHSATSAALTLIVAAAPLHITTASCPMGTQYLAYAGCQIKATGGTGPITYTWAGAIPWTGQLPPANKIYSAIPEGLAEDPSTGMITGTLTGEGAYNVLFIVQDAAGTTVGRPIDFSITGDNRMMDCAYPADSIYSQNISALPVDKSPAAQIWPQYQSSTIKALFGGNQGIPFYRVGPDQPLVPVKTRLGAFPGGRGPIPFDAPMEGTRNAAAVSPPGSNYASDNHVSILQTAGNGKGCAEYSMYNIYPNYPDTGNHAWGGGVTPDPTEGGYSDGYWDMSGYALLPPGHPGGDAAGIPIIPFLANYDTVLGTGTPGAENGVIQYPLRFTMAHIGNNYVWPATHQAGVSSNCVGGYQDKTGTGLISQLDPPKSCAGVTGPTGEIYRLKASVPTPACAATSPQSRVIIQGFRDHGIILADNGISGYVVGTPDPRWNAGDLACLNQLRIADFEPVMTQQLAVNWLKTSQVKKGGASALPGQASGAGSEPVPIPTATIVVTATDATGARVTQQFEIPINPVGTSPAPAAPLAITTDSLPAFAAALPYSVKINTSGGSGQVTFSATGLPPGVTIDPKTGVISGVPKAK